MAKKNRAGYKIAEVVTECYACPFMSVHGIANTKYSNIRCDVLNRRVSTKGVRKDCPLPDWKGAKPKVVKVRDCN